VTYDRQDFNTAVGERIRIHHGRGRERLFYAPECCLRQQLGVIDAQHDALLQTIPVSRLDRVIAERLTAGWVPVDVGSAGAPLGPATPLPADLVLHISYGLEALERGRAALRAADPSGQLWAACVTWLRQARRFGVGAPRAWVTRAARERRLAELAEQAGDMPAAILHYRAALAAHPRVGVRRRLAQLARHWPTPTDGHTPDHERTAADVPHAVSSCRAADASSRATAGAKPRIMAGLGRDRARSSRTRSDQEPASRSR
jgi:hypothetical protein